MSFDLTSPVWLATLLLLPGLGYFFYCSLVDLPRAQQIASLVVRSVICVLLSLALAGLTLLTPTDEVFVVFAVDESLSVDNQSSEAAREFIRQATTSEREGTFAVLPFAATPASFSATAKANSSVAPPAKGNSAVAPPCQGGDGGS